MQIQVNHSVREVPPDWRDESLLVVLREALGLTGTRFGCGAGQCGACTVLIDGQPRRACLMPVAALGAARVETIEGLAAPDGGLHPVQQAWLDQATPQCGYCQSGQIMATVALLRTHPSPTAADIDAALSGNLCRCGTQQRIRASVLRAAQATGSGQ
ncbi:(2Fe-2S)-binding protein [Hydrogenophaga pseudoflava]|uniref:Isoquinoline 1-oxidoreductase subunit alpha n=1 Tax=Hydrogenophaga pseudoflava TaxID=47421 RepID=A0A4P6WZN7_HYDPS|nr:(2Fe-2S)-binding protein [Hydrogenophaga pseudoflava]QBM26901.1 Isoquinoline 1-oxidoreductase subunit alpha [Hydrogenophaga pseudoflava]